MTGHTAENCKYLSAIDAHILDLICSGRTEHISCNSVKKIPKRFFFLIEDVAVIFLLSGNWIRVWVWFYREIICIKNCMWAQRETHAKDWQQLTLWRTQMWQDDVTKRLIRGCQHLDFLTWLWLVSMESSWNAVCSIAGIFTKPNYPTIDSNSIIITGRMLPLRVVTSIYNGEAFL